MCIDSNKNRILALIGNPSETEAIDQLDLLKKHGLISDFNIESDSYKDDNGNIIWEASCDIPEAEEYGEGQGETKWVAEVDSAYRALRILLEWDPYSEYEVTDDKINELRYYFKDEKTIN